MSILFYSLLLVFFSLLLHLIIWKIRLPKKQTNTLLMIFSSVLILGTFFLFKFPELIKWSILSSNNLFEIVQFIFLFLSATLVYIVSYPAIEVDSPTLLIIKAVFDAGPGGLDKSKLELMINDDLLIKPRIRDMLFDNMVYLDGRKYKLLLKGLILARIFSFYRNIIRGGKGG